MSGTRYKRGQALMLTGELVTLRPVTTADLPLLYDLMRDPATWLSASDKPLWPIPFAAFKEMYAKRAADEEAEFSIEADGVLVGRCALFGFDVLSRNATLGISLIEQQRGKGYGRDAVGVLLDYGFNKRNLHRIHLDVLAGNTPAIRSYLSSGFVEEGRLRDAAYVAGGFDDLVVMSMLRTEWLARL
ncbi:MAG: GNAT family protein [Actinomycetota bacterium]